MMATRKEAHPKRPSRLPSKVAPEAERERSTERERERETRARETRAIAQRLEELGLERRYGLEIEATACRACGRPIGRVDGLVYRALKRLDLVTHATYPCTRLWLTFDRKREWFTDEDAPETQPNDRRGGSQS